MDRPRCFFARVGLFSKAGLLTWHSRKPPDWSQLFLGSACKGSFTHVISKKCQRGPKSLKKPSHLGPLDGSWKERLADVVTPLWRLSYEEQLKMKFEAQKKILQRLESYLHMLNGVNVTTAGPKLEGFCCLLHPIPSPVIDGYQNKSTFSVNRGPDGNPKTVGYYLGTWRDQNIVCVWSNHLKNIPEKHSQVAQYYEILLRQSPMEPCLLFHEGGHWHLTVRTNSQGHKLAIITFYPEELRTEELCVQKEETVKEFFTQGPGTVCDLTSLYFQESTVTCCSHQQSLYQLLFGESHLFEDLLDLKIRISLDSFFQVNTAGAEMLYRTVGDLSGVNSNTVLLDICCGTGVIGLSLAQASQVLGIEVVKQAVEDTKWTSAFSGITNCEFHAGRAEILPQLLKSKEDGQLIVAVVNPAWAGLHQVVQAIQNCRAIRTLVFVSCKHGETTRNIIELCCPPNSAKKRLDEPFILRQALPVDLFPHTPHCELVLLFNSLSSLLQDGRLFVPDTLHFFQLLLGVGGSSSPCYVPPTPDRRMVNGGLTLTTSLLPGGDGPTDITPVEKVECQIAPPCIASFYFFATREVGWKVISVFGPTDTTTVGDTEGPPCPA
ncbi:LOW QUALITY PROTEIN: tRNA (uracil-5-)-methyltransferase homolog B [Hipposideros larvatus]